MREIVIRPARREDVAVIAAFNQAMAMETEGRHLVDAIIVPGVQALLDHPERGFYIIAECEQQPVACLLVTYEWSDWRNGLFWWIQSVYVIQDFRRQGVYRQMYDHLKQMAVESGGICGFRLYVDNDNQRAQATYSDLGMSECHYRMYEELVDPTK